MENVNKRAFSTCLAVSPFLVVPILYDSELNSLSLPTVPQHKSLKSIFLTSVIQSEIAFSLRPSTRTACLPDKLWFLWEMSGAGQQQSLECCPVILIHSDPSLYVKKKNKKQNQKQNWSARVSFASPTVFLTGRQSAGEDKETFYHQLETRFTRALTLNQSVGLKTKMISWKVLKCAAGLRGTAQLGYIFLQFYHHCSSCLNDQQWFNTFLIFNHD